MHLRLHRLKIWIEGVRRSWFVHNCQIAVRLAFLVSVAALLGAQLAPPSLVTMSASGRFTNTTTKSVVAIVPTATSAVPDHTSTPVLMPISTLFVVPSPTPNVGPLSVLVRVSWYDPALCFIRPINCKEPAYWWNMGDGKNATEWYDRALACPKEYYSRTFLIEGLRGPRTCYDGGGSIFVEEDGTIRVDVLTQHPIVTGLRNATLLPLP